MEDLKSFEAGRDVPENLARARRAANLGDVSHTVLHAQEAVCLSMEMLTREIAALRRELRGASAASERPGRALAD
jgi:hypothetical protein